MWAWASKKLAVGVVAIAWALSGCTVDTTASTGPSLSGATSGGSSGGSGSSSSGAGTQPMLVDVDPNGTLTAVGGNGVGVFTEYMSGGHWNVSWTCDTNETGFGCRFDVAISALTGSIGNVAGQFLEHSDDFSQSSSSDLAVTTMTSTGIDGVTFDAARGAIITVDAKMNGVDDGAIMFFVQDNTINGGYKGTLTDPLMFEPSSP